MGPPSPLSTACYLFRDTEDRGPVVTPRAPVSSVIFGFELFQIKVALNYKKKKKKIFSSAILLSDFQISGHERTWRYDSSVGEGQRGQLGEDSG